MFDQDMNEHHILTDEKTVLEGEMHELVEEVVPSRRVKRRICFCLSGTGETGASSEATDHRKGVRRVWRVKTELPSQV